MNQCDKEHEVCPYDRSHMILKGRMLTHLARCSKNFRDCEKRPCLYNKKHIIPHPEWEYHKASCPDRVKVDLYNMKVGEIGCPVKTEVPISIDMPPSEENWDEEPVAGNSVLNKIKDVGDKNIIVVNGAIGKSKSKRKELRKIEIYRHNRLAENERQISPPPSIKTASDKKVPNSEPIRVPTETKNTSSQLQIILKRNEECARNLEKFPSKGVTEKKVDSNSKVSKEDEGGLLKLVDDVTIKLSSKLSDVSEDSIASRLAANQCNSYASLLAKRQRQVSEKDTLSIKENKNFSGSHKTNEAGSIDNMEVLNSSIYKKGIREYSKQAVNPSPTSSLLSQSSVSSIQSPPVDDINLLTDEHGFLHMPVPGKGRGKIIYNL